MGTLMIPVSESDGRGYREGMTRPMPRDAGWGVAKRRPQHAWEIDAKSPTGYRLVQLKHSQIGRMLHDARQSGELT